MFFLPPYNTAPTATVAQGELRVEKAGGVCIISQRKDLKENVTLAVENPGEAI